MADAGEVLELLTDLRTAHGVRERLRVLRRARDVLLGLDPAERRDLALAVAREAAPQWVPRLEEQTGLDLDPGDVKLVLELLDGMDEAQVERVGQAVRDPDARRELAADVVRGAATAAAAATEEPAEPPAPDPVPPPAPEPPESTPAPERTPATPEPAPPLPPPPPDPVRDVSLVPPPPAPEPRPPQAPAAPVPSLATRLAAASSARERLGLLDGAGAAVWELGPTGRAAVIDAVPDGWVRRRALQRWVDLDVITPAEAPALVRRLARRTDRAWLAASLVDSGILDVGDLPGVCAPRDAARLARRYTAASGADA